MSAPAQKLGPSPASTTARASPTSAKASVSSPISAASKAFRRSGLASVTRSTGPSRSIRSPLTCRTLLAGKREPAHEGNEALARATFPAQPAPKVGPPAEEDEHPPAAVVPLDEAAANVVASRTSLDERGRRRLQRGSTAVPERPGLHAALVVGIEPTAQDLVS